MDIHGTLLPDSLRIRRDRDDRGLYDSTGAPEPIFSPFHVYI
jgi:hypothetical protein